MIRGRIADIIVSVYLLITLYFRFKVEASLGTLPIISIALGLVMLLVLWALIKTRILEPNYFGLLPSREEVEEAK